MPPDPGAEAGLPLRSPAGLRLALEPSPAGPIPVLSTADRVDFVLLMQALTARNEPRPVPDAVGACLVSGFNNWDRIRQYREEWERGRTAGESWDEEFRRIIPHKELYQDRFVLLFEGPYSGVAARDLGLSEAEWRRQSLALRRAHEGTHYLLLRLLGRMRDHPLDELVADWAGLRACGGYRAAWALRFLGLEALPHDRESGRLGHYCGARGLSAAAFAVVQRLLAAAAANLERLECTWQSSPADAGGEALRIMALAAGTLEELAAPEAGVILQRRLDELELTCRPA
jgi:hypothetical protein